MVRMKAAYDCVKTICQYVLSNTTKLSFRNRVVYVKLHVLEIIKERLSQWDSYCLAYTYIKRPGQSTCRNLCVLLDGNDEATMGW